MIYKNSAIRIEARVFAFGPSDFSDGEPDYCRVKPVAFPGDSDSLPRAMSPWTSKHPTSASLKRRQNECAGTNTFRVLNKDNLFELSNNGFILKYFPRLKKKAYDIRPASEMVVVRWIYLLHDYVFIRIIAPVSRVFPTKS